MANKSDRIVDITGVVGDDEKSGEESQQGAKKNQDVYKDTMLPHYHMPLYRHFWFHFGVIIETRAWKHMDS
ncbi:hypothetical protein L1987_32058 [Smallanthus sonchifolius]|uniref:Uncharacterized protein n=1 Tax=Smallanthus sonchifolius TaxID=185202 RepID=A0ACB9I7B5_9ASTR|nr:hypothetical protein L1987_32058 [Smallanthus sonchifolius]